MPTHFAANYRPEQEGERHLSIWARPGAAAWALHDLHASTCVALATGNGDDLPEPDRLPRHPSSISLIVEPELSTLVPDAALMQGEEARYLELVHGPLPAGHLRHEQVHELGAKCIFQHDEATERRMLKQFPSARPIALRTLLINAALARGDGTPLMLLHRGHRRCDLVIAKGRHVLLSNSFHAPAATDLLYFALFTLEQSGLAPGGVRLLLAGPMLARDERDLLDRYFPTVAPAIATNDRTIAGLGIGSPEQWLCVLDQWSCGS